MKLIDRIARRRPDHTYDTTFQWDLFGKLRLVCMHTSEPERDIRPTASPVTYLLLRGALWVEMGGKTVRYRRPRIIRPGSQPFAFYLDSPGTYLEGHLRLPWMSPPEFILNGDKPAWFLMYG